jgi:hypothetical protein
VRVAGGAKVPLAAWLRCGCPGDNVRGDVRAIPTCCWVLVEVIWTLRLIYPDSLKIRAKLIFVRHDAEVLCKRLSRIA